MIKDYGAGPKAQECAFVPGSNPSHATRALARQPFLEAFLDGALQVIALAKDAVVATAAATANRHPVGFLVST